MKKIIISFIIILATSVGFVDAQRGYVSFNYAPSFTVGNLNDYISQPSPRGFIFDYKYAVNEKFFVGVDVGWNYFYERKDFAVYEFDNVAISGIQYRNSYSTPVMFSAEYYFITDSNLRPYINFGIGSMYTKRSTDMGMYRVQTEVWQFVLRPEIGFMYELFPKGALKFSAKYYNAFEADHFKGQSYISLGLGYVILL